VYAGISSFLKQGNPSTFWSFHRAGTENYVVLWHDVRLWETG